MVANYVNKIGVQNIDGTYSYQDIGTDSDHIEVDAAGKKLSTKLTELENATPDVATSATPGIVKPGTGMEVDGTGALNLTYDHTLTLKDNEGHVLGTYNGSSDKDFSVATIPTDHSSVNTTYGVATTGKYGHVKIVDTYQTEPGATNGTVASATALHEAYKELKGGAGIHKTQAEYNALPESEQKNGSTYFVDDGKDGTLTSDNVAYDNSVSGLSAKYVKTAIDELAVKSAKPTAHSSSVATTYGAGTGNEFGHVRLSDSYKASDGNADASVAASSYALYQAYNELNSNLSANNNHFYFDYKNGKYGYNTDSSRGADTFHPFKDMAIINKQMTYVNVKKWTVDISNEYPEYSKLTIDNICVQTNWCGANAGIGTRSFTYDSINGIITCNSTVNDWYEGTNTCKIFIIN